MDACPVDCIQLENVSANATGWDAWSSAQADLARCRYERHTQRLGAKTSESSAAPIKQVPVDAAETALVDVLAGAAQTFASVSDKKSATIKAALLRARTSRQSKSPSKNSDTLNN